MNYLLKDHLGSINYVLNDNGEVEQELNFDAWGRRRDPATWTFTDVPETYKFDWGYTGHVKQPFCLPISANKLRMSIPQRNDCGEHLDAFGLINMSFAVKQEQSESLLSAMTSVSKTGEASGRMYDPMLGRFLSPDNYVQAPDYTQNFNRYSYVLNNPLKYTDPSGEVYQILSFGVAFLGDYLSNLINGWHDPAGTAYNNATNTINGVNNCAQIPVYRNGNTVATVGLSPFSMGLSANVNITNGNTTQNFHASFGFLGWDVGGSTTFNSGDFSFTVGGGYSSGYGNVLSENPEVISGSQFFSGMSYYDRNRNQHFSFGLTSFYGDYPQKNWYVGYARGDFSFAMTNDAFTGSDWYRTAAAEIGIGEMSFGFNLFTTEPPLEEYISKPHKGGDSEYISPIHGKNPLGTYKTGSRVFAGMYLGYRNGNRVSRFGIDNAWVQDLFQNGIHRWVVPTPYFNTNYGSPSAPFLQGGYVNPFSLYTF